MVKVDFVELLFQLGTITLMVLVIKGMIDKVARIRQACRGTYGKGLPERRKRPRITLRDPSALAPRPVAPGETI